MMNSLPVVDTQVRSYGFWFLICRKKPPIRVVDN
jgi:hypothetical protein